MLNFAKRGFFKSRLFNDVTQLLLDTLLPSIVKQYGLISAKGGTGRNFTGKLAESIYNSTDMPYHIHILNGLIPSLKLLEEKFEQEQWLHNPELILYLKCFIVGFTFHDINKIVGNEELNQAVEGFIVQLCENLGVSSFFLEWKEWIEEIKFLVLSTEYRTKIYGIQKTTIREYEFFNTILAEYSHVADAIASIQNIKNTSEFYEKLSNCRLDGKKLSALWDISYIEVQENIFTLLSQKLLLTVKNVIQNKYKQKVLFSLRNGFIFLGKPLNRNEVENIKIDFMGDLSDVVASTQIDHQSCKLGFLETLTEETSDAESKYTIQIINALKKVIEVSYDNGGKGTSKIKILKIADYSKDLETNQTKPQDIALLEQLLDEEELPIKIIEVRSKKGNIENYLLVLNKQNWEDIKEEHDFLSLLALEKIRLFSGNIFPEWKKWKENICKSQKKLLNNEFSYSELIAKFPSVTDSTIIALISAIERKNRIERLNLDLRKYVEKRFQKIANKLVTKVKVVNKEELNNFVDFYLSGNFEREINNVINLIEEIPPKNSMCIFSGRLAKTKYGAERAFGVSALNFSNRSLNTLKNKDNQISTLFLAENDLRQKELPQGFYTKKLKDDEKKDLKRQYFSSSSDANTIIYYDLGEYFIDVLKQPILQVLSKAFSYDCKDINGLTLIFDEQAYDYNLYGMNFNKVGNDVESNFYFIYQILKLIKKTCFRIFVTDLITPYQQHKEMFVFENCMPFVKVLGWNKTRIDQLEERLQEMKLLLELNKKRLVSNILNYAEDSRYLFTAFEQVDDKEKSQARSSLSKFIEIQKGEQKEKLMSTMNNLAQIAIEMVHPKSSSSSQETWIIRDALKVLKDCYKEKCDEETIIEQIAGDLRKTLKNRDYANLNMCEPFAKILYKELFIGEWNKHFPSPSRLRNWVNQFAFIYSEKGYLENRKKTVRKIVKELQKTYKEEITEDIMIQNLIKDNSNLAKYSNDYREAFQQIKEEFVVKNYKEISNDN